MVISIVSLLFWVSLTSKTDTKEILRCKLVLVVIERFNTAAIIFWCIEEVTGYNRGPAYRRTNNKQSIAWRSMATIWTFKDNIFIQVNRFQATNLLFDGRVYLFFRSRQWPLMRASLEPFHRKWKWTQKWKRSKNNKKHQRKSVKQRRKISLSLGVIVPFREFLWRIQEHIHKRSVELVTKTCFEHLFRLQRAVNRRLLWSLTPTTANGNWK